MDSLHDQIRRAAKDPENYKFFEQPHIRDALEALGYDSFYVNEQGIIVAINRMEPCKSVAASNCPTYPAGAEFVQAIEMNAGFFSRYQLTLGDRLQTAPTLCASRP